MQEYNKTLELKIEERTKEIQKANAELEEINKELDDFTYIVSHDLKEPLRSINAFTKFVLEDCKDKISQDDLYYLERIKDNTNRMHTLIEDLLEVSHIDRKKNPFEKVDGNRIIEEIKARMEFVFKQKKVQLEIKGERLPVIFCDRVRITEVFANLISNAIKFADKDPVKIEVGYQEEGVFYKFHIKDNGPGIEEKYFDKIFQIFQRLGRKEDSEGTGAGLTIVKKIVEMHKGRVWIESVVGEGAVFYFTIPKDREYILGGKKIGEILIEKNLVTEEQVKEALKLQEKRKG